MPDQKDDVSRIIQGSAECRIEDIRPVGKLCEGYGENIFQDSVYDCIRKSLSRPCLRAVFRLRKWFMPRVMGMRRISSAA